jgi:hypothetical protein
MPAKGAVIFELRSSAFAAASDAFASDCCASTWPISDGE